MDLPVGYGWLITDEPGVHHRAAKCAAIIQEAVGFWLWLIVCSTSLRLLDPRQKIVYYLLSFVGRYAETCQMMADFVCALTALESFGATVVKLQLQVYRYSLCLRESGERGPDQNIFHNQILQIRAEEHIQRVGGRTDHRFAATV